MNSSKARGQKRAGGSGFSRSVEWHYWLEECHNELLTFPAHTGVPGVTIVITGIVFSPDGLSLAKGMSLMDEKTLGALPWVERLDWEAGGRAEAEARLSRPKGDLTDPLSVPDPKD